MKKMILAASATTLLLAGCANGVTKADLDALRSDVAAAKKN